MISKNHIGALTIALIMSTGQATAQLWEVLTPIPEDLTFPVVAVIDNHIHIMGGGASGGATGNHYRYDATTDSWISRAQVPYLAVYKTSSLENEVIISTGHLPHAVYLLQVSTAQRMITRKFVVNR